MCAHNTAVLTEMVQEISRSTRVTGSPSRYNFATICGIRKP